MWAGKVLSEETTRWHRPSDLKSNAQTTTPLRPHTVVVHGKPRMLAIRAM